MPVVRIPVQHKFGIVSLSRAEQLLARSSHRKEQKDKARCVSPRSPSHELNQAFIIKVTIIEAGCHFICAHRILINLKSILQYLHVCAVAIVIDILYGKINVSTGTGFRPFVVFHQPFSGFRSRRAVIVYHYSARYWSYVHVHLHSNK